MAAPLVTVGRISEAEPVVPDAPFDGRPTRAEAEEAVRTLIRWAGDDPDREGLKNTPARVARAYRDLFSGYAGDVETALGVTFEDVHGYDDMVLVRDIAFHSHCEHHMVPFFGKVHVGYLPEGGVVGLSKLARVVDIFARRLQTQETLTAQIVDALMTTLEPRGVAVMIEAEHMCMTMRGVHKPGAVTITSRFAGVFKDDAAGQQRFLNLVRDPRLG